MKKLFSKMKENFSNNIKPKLKAIFTKQVLTIIGIVLLIIALCFGGVKLYGFSRTAYLRPYIHKYDIEFPEGILKEMCDDYGEDQTVRGKFTIEDLDCTKKISNIIKNENAFFENGTDVAEDQHFRAIRINENDVDLESLYSTADLYLKSSQKVELTTLYKKEEYKVVAAFYTNTNPEDDNGYVFPHNFCGNMSEKDFKAYEDRITHRALYDTGYEFSYDDYYLSINAPSDFMEDFRFVIVCVRADKKGVKKSETATPNEKIHFPQVWYDANDENNPYIFAGKWYPKSV